MPEFMDQSNIPDRPRREPRRPVVLTNALPVKDTPTASDTAARARALLDAATPGPWTHDPEFRTLVSVDGEAWEAIAVETPTKDVAMVWAVDDARDAALIAAAPTLITDLLAEVDRLTAESADVRQQWRMVYEQAVTAEAERDAAVARANHLEAAIGKHLNDHADERGEQFGCCCDDEVLWSAAFDRGTDR